MVLMLIGNGKWERGQVEAAGWGRYFLEEMVWGDCG